MAVLLEQDLDVKSSIPKHGDPIAVRPWFCRVHASGSATIMTSLERFSRQGGGLTKLVFGAAPLVMGQYSCQARP